MSEQVDELPIPAPMTQGHWSYDIRIVRPTLPTKAYAWNIDRHRVDVGFGAGQAGVAHGMALSWNEAVQEATRAREQLMSKNRDTD